MSENISKVILARFCIWFLQSRTICKQEPTEHWSPPYGCHSSNGMHFTNTIRGSDMNVNEYFQTFFVLAPLYNWSLGVHLLIDLNQTFLEIDKTSMPSEMHQRCHDMMLTLYQVFRLHPLQFAMRLSAYQIQDWLLFYHHHLPLWVYNVLASVLIPYWN